MTSLDRITALQLEGKSISIATVLRFANMRGRFEAIDEYLSHALIAAYAEEHRITASQEDIQAVVDEWRVERGVHQAVDENNWLAERGLTTADLADYARMIVLENAVRHHAVSGEIERHFRDNRSDFDAAAISRIVVKDRRLARELIFKTMEGAEFYSLARQYSEDESTRLAGGFVGRVEGAQMSREMASRILGSDPDSGTIIGPLEIDGLFYVIRIEEVYPAELTSDVRARVERFLFEEWLSSRRKQANARYPLWEQQ